MATKSENSDIAVLQDQMETVKTDLKTANDGIKAISAALSEKYVRKEEFKSFKWITVPLVIIITAAITALVSFYFTHKDVVVQNQPTTSTTTTTTTPTGSTGTTSTQATPSSSPTVNPQSSGGLLDPLKKVIN